MRMSGLTILTYALALAGNLPRIQGCGVVTNGWNPLQARHLVCDRKIYGRYNGRYYGRNVSAFNPFRSQGKL